MSDTARAHVGTVALAAVALAPCVLLAGAVVAALTDGVAAMGTLRPGDPWSTLVYSSLRSVVGTLLVAAPMGAALGAWLARARRTTLAARVADMLLDALAAVPAGLLGAVVGAVAAANHARYMTALVAALALVVLPGVGARAVSAFREVSRDRVDAALALGASRAQAFWHVTLAAVWRPLTAAVLRAAARAAGEGVVAMIVWQSIGGATVDEPRAVPMAIWVFWAGSEAASGVASAAGALVAFTVAATLGAAALEDGG